MSKRLNAHSVKKSEFKVAEKVLLSTKELQQNKLTLFQPCCIGPSAITKVLGDQAVSLHIPENRKIFTTYNVRLIKKCEIPYNWMDKEKIS
jgi:hypothetical protein